MITISDLLEWDDTTLHNCFNRLSRHRLNIKDGLERETDVLEDSIIDVVDFLGGSDE